MVAVPVENQAQVYELLRIASGNRSQAETLLNKNSSRSHWYPITDVLCFLFITVCFNLK